jgi:hypothetical protein
MLAVLALLFLSFAHQPTIARQLSPQLAADYVLPDGTIAEICFGLDGLSGNAPHGRHQDGRPPFCEACRQSATALLPPPADTNYLLVRVEALPSEAWKIEAPVIAYARPLPPSHGPPVFA